MKKILLICFVLLFLGIDIVKADPYSEECAQCSFLTSPEQVEECIRINCRDSTSSNTYSKIVCGDTDVPYIAAQVTSTIITILKIATPVIIIIFGMIDLVKAVIAQKEDDISKGGKTFLKRTIIGVCVFLVFVFVQLIIGLVAPQDDNVNMWNCVDCFVNNNCSKVAK